jgi:hypothetical protein
LCANYGTGHSGINCSYTSQQQCLASVSGVYGFCTPNPYPGTGWNFLVPPTPHRRICGHRQRNDDVDLVSCLFLGDTPAARGLDRNGAVLPDIPTVGEFVPGYEASAWQGIGAPKNTPAEIIDRLNTEINAGLAAVLWGVAARHVAAGPPPTRGR